MWPFLKYNYILTIVLTLNINHLTSHHNHQNCWLGTASLLSIVVVENFRYNISISCMFMLYPSLYFIIFSSVNHIILIKFQTIIFIPIYFCQMLKNLKKKAVGYQDCCTIPTYEIFYLKLRNQYPW